MLVITLLKKFNTGDNAFKAGHEYEIVSMGASFGDNTATANSDAKAILDGNFHHRWNFAKGDKFTVDADILNAENLAS